MMKKNPRKFTLIELLIVVAIIIVLISLIQPALSQAIDKARMVLCLNNNRQNLNLLAVFADDHKGQIPLQYGTHEPRNSAYFFIHNQFYNFGVLWNAGIQPNITDNLMCPDFPYWEIEHLTEENKMDSLKDNVLTHYNMRPEKQHGGTTNLVRQDDYSDKAVVTENLYFWYYARWNLDQDELFHVTGLMVGYGDGSAKFVTDETGYIEMLKIDRSTNFYRTKGEDWPKSTGIWGILDERY